MENKIPTAVDFWFQNQRRFGGSIERALIEFAKLHVEPALKRAYKNQGWSWTNSTNEEVKLDLFMRNSYPPENIK